MVLALRTPSGWVHHWHPYSPSHHHSILQRQLKVLDFLAWPECFINLNKAIDLVYLPDHPPSRSLVLSVLLFTCEPKTIQSSLVFQQVFVVVHWCLVLLNLLPTSGPFLEDLLKLVHTSNSSSWFCKMIVLAKEVEERQVHFHICSRMKKKIHPSFMLLHRTRMKRNNKEMNNLKCFQHIIWKKWVA